MTLHFREIIKKGTFVLILFLTSLACFSQQKLKPNKDYAATKQTHTLDSIFPIDDILSITVTNYYGTHQLTTNELAVLKEQLKKAKFSGGLLKPGHIWLKIMLKENTTAKTGFVYAKEGSIHFDGGTSRFNKRFSGTYYLPVSLNFDNYK